MKKLTHLSALEILDSRGTPTVQATAVISGRSATVSVPSGASTGSAEARELRDGEPSRYRGKGCRQAVAGIEGEIRAALVGRPFRGQEELDAALIALDGTPQKARLGANALLAVSLAFARAAAAAEVVPLYAYFAALARREASTLPRLTVNLFSGGKHAGGQVPIQDVLVVPLTSRDIDESLAMTWAVYQTAAELVARRYGMRALKADEGGLAPDFESVDAMFEAALEAMRAAGLQPGRDMALAVDVASTQFHRQGHYHLGGQPLDSRGMIDRILSWVNSYPIVSVEDGLAEDDTAAWPDLRARLDGRARVLGDDYLCTNPERIRRAVATRSADALLLKVNQIGTLTEALTALRVAREARWSVTVSARSGETEDSWLADLAVGWGGDYIKIGSITQSERLAKYNRLLQIEHEARLPLAPPPAP